MNKCIENYELNFNDHRAIILDKLKMLECNLKCFIKSNGA